MGGKGFERREVPRFGRGFFRSGEPVTRIGDGRLGGKAQGLVVVRDLLRDELDAGRFPGLEVHVPAMVVVATDVFDRFVRDNGLERLSREDLPDERIAQAFLRADLPAEIAGDLRALVEEARAPLAVRSSSLLEDALFRPFAGVYETKMVPNNQPDADTRFLRLAEAVKFVYASTWFRAARDYLRAARTSISEEKMAVVIQEVVGARHGDRYYPNVSGVGRSYNFFPAQGSSPGDGVVNLALGLGKTIVDGGSSWIYSPTRPKAPPPFNSIREMLRLTQLDFWAVNMGKPPAYDPVAETEYLVRCELSDADYDGTLATVSSTYDAARDRVVPGTGVEGPRVIDFQPLLGDPDLPINAAVRELLSLGERSLGEAVEIEFAVVLPEKTRPHARFGFLQLRPMLVSDEEVALPREDLDRPDVLLASDRVMGNGIVDTILDVVYVKPETFEARLTPRIPTELETLNRTLLEEGRPYMLIGFGRWGSSDPWLGIPVKWGQIAGARVIVESTLAGMDVEPSQGAHFFHNLIGFRVAYLCVHHEGGSTGFPREIDWSWLRDQAAVAETEHVRHVRLEAPLLVKVDGRAARGAVWHP